jgi:hypothetical protein
VVGYLAAYRGDTDDRRSDARIEGIGYAHLRQAEVDRTTGKTHLPDAQFGAPVGDAEAGLGMVIIADIAEVQQVGRL